MRINSVTDSENEWLIYKRCGQRQYSTSAQTTMNPSRNVEKVQQQPQRYMRTDLLWQFLLELLIDPDNMFTIEWITKAVDGPWVFIVHDMGKLAELWRAHKNNKHRIDTNCMYRSIMYYSYERKGCESALFNGKPIITQLIPLSHVFRFTDDIDHLIRSYHVWFPTFERKLRSIK